MQQVLITGATSGIGRQLALDYIKQGWIVWACGRNQAALTELKQAAGEHLHPLCFDINDVAQIGQAARKITALDLAILNAGTCEYIDDAKQFDGALFERVMQTNVISLGYCLQHFLPLIKRGGKLALMGSSASYLALPRAEAYGASKAAVSYLARTLAIDLKPSGIAVSLINPGFVNTPLTAKNDFPMPMSIDVAQASAAIMAGLAKDRFDVHFPKKFTFILKTLAMLPEFIWQGLAARIRK
ncbi:SDR family NAD(P)-dependent oxidoreductase [Motilimonas eburnea]|uniref:SDR family NAD(P)-dependent oxidoreductase n=1 Tax=Motilimonas eburnea TaxID=1737488 RepID=UPI001E43F84D|nr:SDR family NAD(P)-dependent oxidoreductase [Motilimonas eburnea]MCE2573135.1 SDR family NAD(P)-dependent oxidoreductase [Motilimonas eburnea]